MIIDGRKISASILEQLETEVRQLPFVPIFCDVLVGGDPVSAKYVQIKAQAAEKIGIKFRRAEFGENVEPGVLIEEIKNIATENSMCGLIIQLPLPATLPRQEILDAVNPSIDVDCMNTQNLKRFYGDDIYFYPPTAAAVLEILDSLNLTKSNKHFLVLGQGDLVGKPTAYLLKKLGLNVSVADTNTKNPELLLKNADVLIAATGQAGLVKGEQLKPGCVVIDAGTAEQNGGIVGDVDLDSVLKIAAYVSPVPGGVGPVTVAMLLKNVVAAAKIKSGGA